MKISVAAILIGFGYISVVRASSSASSASTDSTTSDASDATATATTGLTAGDVVLTADAAAQCAATEFCSATLLLSKNGGPQTRFGANAVLAGAIAHTYTFTNARLCTSTVTCGQVCTVSAQLDTAVDATTTAGTLSSTSFTVTTPTTFTQTMPLVSGGNTYPAPVVTVATCVNDD